MSDYNNMIRCLWKGVADTDQQIDAADRIEELEAKLDWVLVERDETFALMLDRAQTAEAKLAKAVEALHWIGTRSIMLDAGADSLRLHARMILAELKGEK